MRFSDIGPEKRSWEERVTRPINETAIERAVRGRGGLLSRDIQARFAQLSDLAGDTSDWRGNIFAGVRQVGKFEILRSSGE